MNELRYEKAKFWALLLAAVIIGFLDVANVIVANVVNVLLLTILLAIVGWAYFSTVGRLLSWRQKVPAHDYDKLCDAFRLYAQTHGQDPESVELELAGLTSDEVAGYVRRALEEGSDVFFGPSEAVRLSHKRRP